jgi:hypothetical protein
MSDLPEPLPSLTERFGSARRPGRPPQREHPAGISAATVTALGTLSKALEYVENARGALYTFHQLSGTADLTLQDAVRELREAGHDALATEIAEILVGRDVVQDLWTFQIVDAYDEQYWSVFRAVEQHARDQAGVPDRHVYEAELKHHEQSE